MLVFKPGICYKIHSKELPVPLFTTLDDIEEAQDIYFPDHTAMSSDDSCSDYEEPLFGPQQFSQSELNAEYFAFQKTSLKFLLQDYKKRISWIRVQRLHIIGQGKAPVYLK